MSNASRNRQPAKPPTSKGPFFVYHASFEEAGAERTYGRAAANNDDQSLAFMPDDVTRDCTKRMHYAAWRSCGAGTERGATHWRRVYHDHRDRIVLGNRKLIYRAVHKWGSISQIADDMVGECQIVLIKAVAAYNPWLGIRFSTYAFTCLMRALSRLSQRHAADRLFRSLSLESLPHGEPSYVSPEVQSAPRIALLGEYLRYDDPLLTTREKLVLSRRFQLNEQPASIETLEQVGRDLGLSKERVRQVQKLALGKLRHALLARTSV
jgi:RNA polymerase sigma factor (sigma-70 family)